MKNFKKYIKEETGVANHVVWNSSDRGTATLMIPKKEFEKNQDAASLTALKTRVHNAKALTKLKADKNTIKNAGGVKDGQEFYLVQVEFTTKALAEETKDGPPTASDRVKDKHEREKEDLKKRQDNEKQKAREDDFRRKEADRKREQQRKDSEARAKKVNEYLEDGTDELVDTYKDYTPGQKKDIKEAAKKFDVLIDFKDKEQQEKIVRIVQKAFGRARIEHVNPNGSGRIYARFDRLHHLDNAKYVFGNLKIKIAKELF